MKKFIFIFTVLILILSFVGCSEKTTDVSSIEIVNSEDKPTFEKLYPNDLQETLDNNQNTGIFAKRSVIQRVYKDANSGIDMTYCFILPQYYNSEEKYPIVLYLHGTGVEGSDGVKHMGLVNTMYNNAFVWFDNAIVVAPQRPEGTTWTVHGNENNDFKGTLSTVKKILYALECEYSCDTDRIYATGYSSGGYGVWDMAAEYNDLFAAIVTVSGWYDSSAASLFTELPIWIYHGTEDESVPFNLSEEMYNSITKLGSHQITFTRLDGIGHEAYKNAYSDGTMYSWLFEQRKS